MAEYGWEVYNQGVVSSSRDRYIQLVDQFKTGSDGGYSSSVTRSYPDYAGCDLSVIPSNVRIWDEGLSISITYDSDDVPTIDVSSGISQIQDYWVICTRVSTTAPIMGDQGAYGLMLMDGADGIAYTADTPTLYFLERYRGSEDSIPTDIPEYWGWVEVETYSDTPPLCFYRPVGTNPDIRQPITMMALPSPNDPEERNYRWVVGCEFGSTSGSRITNGHDFYCYVFDVFEQERTVDFGISLFSSTGKEMVLGDGAPLVMDDVITGSNFIPDPNDDSRIEVDVYQWTGFKALTIIPQIINNTGPNNEPHFCIFKNPYEGISGLHGQGNYATPDPPDVDATWFRDALLNMDYRMGCIDTATYDAIVKIEDYTS